MKLVFHASPLIFISHMQPNTSHFTSLFIYPPSPCLKHPNPNSPIHNTLFSRATVVMANRDHPPPHQLIQTGHHRYEVGGGAKSLLPQKGPSTGQILAIVTLLPVGGALLGLAGITLVGSLIGLAVAIPLFIIFSPVLVPATILLVGTLAAFLTSGAFGLTGLSSLSWVLNWFWQAAGEDPLEHAKRRAQEGTLYVSDKTKQFGDTIKSKAAEGGGREGTAAGRT